MQTQIISMLARRSAFSTHKPRGIRISAGFHTGQNQNRTRIQFAADRPPVLISMDFLSPVPGEPFEPNPTKIGNLGVVSFAAGKFNVAAGLSDKPYMLCMWGLSCTQKLLKNQFRVFCD